MGATSAAQTITLNNTGNAALTISSIAVTGTNPSDFAQTNTCGSSRSGRSQLHDQRDLHARREWNSHRHRHPHRQRHRQPAEREPLPARVRLAVASLSPISLTFASQAVGATSAAQTVTLNNTGNAALSLTSIALTGTNPSDFAQTNNAVSVAAGANCTISVTFTPTAERNRTAAVTLTDNATGSPQSVSLTGTGTAPV